MQLYTPVDQRWTDVPRILYLPSILGWSLSPAQAFQRSSWLNFTYHDNWCDVKGYTTPSDKASKPTPLHWGSQLLGVKHGCQLCACARDISTHSKLFKLLSILKTVIYQSKTVKYIINRLLTLFIISVIDAIVHNSLCHSIHSNKYVGTTDLNLCKMAANCAHAHVTAPRTQQYSNS